MNRPAAWLLLPLLTGTLWLARPARRLPGDALTSEADGLGPITERWYWLNVQDASLPAEALVGAVLDDFPRIMPPPLVWTRKVRGVFGAGRPGDQYFLLLLLRRAWVQTEACMPTSFRNRTLRHHPEAGWVQFSAENIGGPPGSYRLTVHSRVRASTRLDRLSYLLGMREVQRLMWETVLRRALALSGGRQVGWGHRTVEYPAAPPGRRFADASVV